MILLLSITSILVSALSEELFEFPKIIFLYLVTGIFLLFNKNVLKQLQNVPRAFFLWGLAIIFTNILSTIFSIDIYTSIFGYYTRFTGSLISTICFVFWMFIVATEKKRALILEKLTTAYLMSAVVVSILGIIQKTGVDKFLWVSDSSLRVFSTLGQPNWLAAYLIPAFFISIAKLFQSTKNKIHLTIITIIIYTAFWFTYSASGSIALIISSLIFFVYISKSDLKNNFKYLTAILIGIIFISFIFLGTYKQRLIEFKNNLIPLAQAQTDDPNYVKTGDTANIRLILWKGTYNLIKSNPKQFLIGSGPQTFVYAFVKFRPDELNLTSEGKLIHNKPHNWFLEILSDTGILGLTIYLGFIIYSLILFHKNAKSKDPMKIALYVGWVSLLITNFFGWPTVITYLIFFIWPVLIL